MDGGSQATERVTQDVKQHSDGENLHGWPLLNTSNWRLSEPFVAFKTIW
jgi:hypothetical protein